MTWPNHGDSVLYTAHDGSVQRVTVLAESVLVSLGADPMVSVLMPDGIVRDTVLERLTKIKRGVFHAHAAPGSEPEPETEPMVVYATPVPEPKVQVIASAPEAVTDTIIPTLDTWITNLDAQDIKPDLEILGVESIEDLKWLDDEDVGVLFEKVFKKMKKIKAKKFMASLKENLD